MVDRRPHVVIVVVNLPAERDRRVIRESQALEDAGYRVTVICPRGPRRPGLLPGTADTRIRSFPQPFAGSGLLSFAAEFAWAFTAVTGRLAALMLRERVDAVQACNPPDVFWLVGLAMRALGRPFVFDHHDLSPELYQCKTDRPNPLALRLLHLLERLSWRCASAVVATNESYRELAITRGGCDPDRVVVVRNGPTLAEVGITATVGALGVETGRTGAAAGTAVKVGPTGTDGDIKPDGIRRGRWAPPPARTPPSAGTLTERDTAAVVPAPRTELPDDRKTVVYLGVINPQDHVRAAVLAAERLRTLRGGADWRLVVAGDGDCLPELRRLAAERGIEDVVRFTGWLEADEVDALLRSAAIGVQPDPRTRMAELSTMAKTVEYLARGLPVVAVDLLETRRTAGAAARYVPNGTPEELAEALHRLLGDDEARTAMGVVARRRFTEHLAWDHQAKSYIRLWRRLLPGDRAGYNSVAIGDETDTACTTPGQQH